MTKLQVVAPSARAQSKRVQHLSRALKSSDRPKNREAVDVEIQAALARVRASFEKVETARGDIENALKSALESAVGHETKLYQAVQAACIVAQRLKRKADAWAKFCDDPGWKGVKAAPKLTDQKRAVKFVLIWGCGKGRRKEASLYYRAVNKLLQQGTDPAHIAMAIKEGGGVRKLASATAAESSSSDRSTNDCDQPPKVGTKAAKSSRRAESIKPSLITATPERDAEDHANSDPIGAIISFKGGQHEFYAAPAGVPLLLECVILEMGEKPRIRVISVTRK